MATINPMSLQHPTIAIIAAGALGSYYGARLVQHHHTVHFLMRSDAAHIKQNGLTIKSHKGDFTLPPEKLHIHSDPSTMPKADLAIIALKSTANAHLDRLLPPILTPDTLLLTLQNGLGNEEKLASFTDPKNVYGGVAFTCINRLSPGLIDHSSHGLIRIGAHHRNESSAPTLTRLAEIFSASNIDCQIMENLQQARWEKLLWNIPFNGLSAALDQTTDKLLATVEGTQLVRQIMQDVITAASAANITINPDLIESHITNTKKMGAYYTSSHVDRQNHRPLEVDALFTLPLKTAEKANLNTPYLKTLHHQIKIVDTNAT